LTSNHGSAPNLGSESKFSDLNMLVNPGGMKRATDEFRALSGAASFGLAQVVPTSMPFGVFEAVPQ
jgi:hypothetical protein